MGERRKTRSLDEATTPTIRDDGHELSMPSRVRLSTEMIVQARRRGSITGLMDEALRIMIALAEENTEQAAKAITLPELALLISAAASIRGVHSHLREDMSGLFDRITPKMSAEAGVDVPSLRKRLVAMPLGHRVALMDAILRVRAKIACGIAPEEIDLAREMTRDAVTGRLE